MRKKILSAFLLLMFFNFADAQDLQIRDYQGNVVNGDTITLTRYYNSSNFANDFVQKKFIKFFNSTSIGMVVKLRREEVLTIPGSYDYYCYGQQCLGPVKAGVQMTRTSNDTVPINPNSYGLGDAPFAVYIDSASSGTAIYRYIFTDEISRTNAVVYVRWVIIDNSANGPNFQLRDSLGNNINGDTIEVNALYRDVTNQTFVKESFLRFYNNTPAKQKISLFRTEYSIIPGSFDQFCFGSGCSPLMTAGDRVTRNFLSQDSIVINANSYFPLDTAFSVRLDSAKSGDALYAYNFSDKINKNNIATIYVKWIVLDVTSIDEIQAVNDFAIYPNPAERVAKLNFETPLANNRQELQLFNILGEEVFRTSLTQGTVSYELNVEMLNEGVYFVNIIADGTRVLSKKLIVK